ncbi:MAG: ABC transporter ATP-binding protein [bacterium]
MSITSHSISLSVHNVVKNFGTEEHTVEVLRGVSIEMEQGDSLVITGPSGSGKSTLLHLIGALDTPTSGTIEINGQNSGSLTEPDLARFRNKVIGFVFQDHHLLPQYTALENVLIPTFASKISNQMESERRAHELLARVGLSERVDHRPAHLSGGERQRVAIARAMINQPSILLCDEPTGNLDRAIADDVADLFFELHQQEGNILIVVTHSLELAARFPKRVELKEGACVEA